MSVNFVRDFGDYLFSLKVALSDDKTNNNTIQECRVQFHKEQLEFHRKLNNLIVSDQTFNQPLSDVLEKTKEVEHTFRTAIQKRNQQVQPSMVKELRTVADAFRIGDDAKGIDLFKNRIPDGHGSVAGEAFGALWKVKKEPRIDDVGRRTFYNSVPDCVSTPQQKALAIEIAMVKLVYKAMESGNDERAESEFHQLPYRLKKEIYLLLAQKKVSPIIELERGRNFLFHFDELAKGIQIECFKGFEKHLVAVYSNSTDNLWMNMLQQDLREVLEAKTEKENQLQTQLTGFEQKESDLFDTLRTTQQVVYQMLQQMHKKMSEQQHQIADKDQAIGSLKESAAQVRSQAELSQKQLQQQIAEGNKTVAQVRSQAEMTHKSLQQQIEEGNKSAAQVRSQAEMTQKQLQQQIAEGSKTVAQVRSQAEMTQKSLQQQIEEGSKTIASLQKDLANVGAQAKESENKIHELYEGTIRKLNTETLELSQQLHQARKAQPKMEQISSSLGEDDFIKLSTPSMMEMFADYVYQKCPNYNVAEVMKFIAEGKDLVARIQNGQAALMPIEERKSKIASVVWYMLYFLVCKNQGFDQGTIVFRDPGHAIAKFFLPCAKPRKSTHLTHRYLPTYFEGEEKITSYGIDVAQDFKTGLPGTKRTVNFCPIESKDGLDWSYFKPEDWGLGDWGQFSMHAWDYMVSRIAHLFGRANGHEDRKEHMIPGLKNTFQQLYREANKNKQVPADVNKFGIAGMKATLEAMMKEEGLSPVTKLKTKKFLDELRTEYDYLDARNGNEAMLGDSFINGELPQEHMHQSLLPVKLMELQTKDAQVRVKTAVHPQELVQALSTLKTKLPLQHLKQGVVDDIAGGFRIDRTQADSLFNREGIFHQVTRDNGQPSVQFLLDGKTFKSAQEMYAHLLQMEPFAGMKTAQEKDQAVLRFMTLLQQGARGDLFAQLIQWFDQPLQGVHVKQLPPKLNEIVAHITVTTGKDPVLQIKQLFQLVGIEIPEVSQLFYRKEPYALIEGTMRIDINQQTAEISAVVKGS